MTRTLSDLASDLAGGRVLSSDLVQDCLATISARNADLHAFNTVLADSALARAAAADDAARRGHRLGPLHGVPFAVKDLADIAGHEPSFGSRCYGRGIADSTAPAIARLEAAGAILIGTTHMVEFAIGSWGTNHAMGTPRNPCDTAVHRVPGGSSSGSAVAVAAGLVPFAIGSDTGGSVRIPAALCGVVGLKPSSGRIPLDGIAQLSATFDTLGPLTRCVADAALLTDVMAGVPVARPTPDLPRVMGFVPLAQLDPIDAEIAVAYDALLRHLRHRGVTLHPVTLPRAPADYQARNGRIVAHEVFGRLGSLAMDTTLPIDPHVRQRVLQGAHVTEAEYRALLADRAAEIRMVHHLLSDMPLVMPTTPIRARRMDEVDEATIPLSRFTRIANYLDLVAVSLPLRGPGLPTGVHIMGQSGSDAAVLATACALEQVISKIQAVPA